ncbi:MAG: hypothetical protein R3266_00100 [Gemmatimonadota bacterium]|nr:hypothetical protein [Gemmatimonadota bacterium]
MNLRRRNSRIGRALTVLLFGGLLAGCSDDDGGIVNPPPPPPPPPSEGVLSGTLTSSQTLDPSLTYRIQGTVIVDDGSTLTIPAGTTLMGDVAFTGSALIVRQGGRLVAEGTPTDPIVFTSSNPPGSRNRADWGGVVLNGRSICNFTSVGEDCVGEGNSGPYGGNVLDDDSGVLSYVRIEYAGFEVSFGNELNGLTLNGVGSGTQIDHVQSHFGSDDGIELFGGTVDIKFAIVTGASDDSFDYSTGWQGRGQFWIVQHDPNDADNGFEIDGNESDPDATPFTDPLIYNVTLVGKESGTGTAGESARGILFRRGTGGDVYNFVVLGFETGIDIDQQETVGRVSIQNSYFFGSGDLFEGDSDGIDEMAIVMDPSWNNVTGVDPSLADPFNLTSPDFRPAAGSPLMSGFASPPNDGFFDQVDFIGGVSPDGTPWYEGWITTDQS